MEHHHHSSSWHGRVRTSVTKCKNSNITTHRFSEKALPIFHPLYRIFLYFISEHSTTSIIIPTVETDQVRAISLLMRSLLLIFMFMTEQQKLRELSRLVSLLRNTYSFFLLHPFYKKRKILLTYSFHHSSAGSPNLNLPELCLFLKEHSVLPSKDTAQSELCRRYHHPTTSAKPETVASRSNHRRAISWASWMPSIKEFIAGQKESCLQFHRRNRSL